MSEKNEKTGNVEKVLLKLKGGAMALCIVLVVGLVAAANFPGSRAMMESVIGTTTDRFLNHTAETRRLQSKISDLEGAWSSQIFGRLKEIKNPMMEGITSRPEGRISAIRHESVKGTENEIAVIALAEWAAKAGFDCVLYGRVYRGIDGVAMFSDVNGNGETDLGIIIESMNGRGITNAVAIIDNPENIYLGYPVKGNMTTGNIEISIATDFMAWPFWETKKLVLNTAEFELKANTQGKYIGTLNDTAHSGSSLRISKVYESLNFVK